MSLQHYLTLEYQFISPDYLRLLYVLPVFWLAAILGYRHLSIWRLLFSTFLRTLVFSLVVLILAGFSWNEKSEREISTIFLLDMSDSITTEGKEWMWNYVEDLEKSMDVKIKKGLICFGNESEIVTKGFEEKLGLDKVRERIVKLDFNSDKTDIASGVIAALGVIPKDSTKMIVLLSDGNENLGDVSKAAKLAADSDIKIFVASPPELKENEILIKRIDVPKDIYEGDTFNVKVVVENKGDNVTKGTLTLYQKDALMREWNVDFKKGINILEVPYKSKEKGFVKFMANLDIEDADMDKDKSNNNKVSFVNVSGKARILYVDGAINQRIFLPDVLKNKAISVDIKDPSEIPTSLQEYLKYDSLVFSNVSRNYLDDEQMEFIKEYVEDFGGGFVMTCGDNIFAEDGYSGTVIEEILPVNIIGGEPPKQEKRTRLSLVLIIDKSGSMLGKKMLFAKKASVELVKQLKENDEFGIIAFDTIPYVIVDLKPTGEARNEIINKLSMLHASGGTDIFSALDVAYKQIVRKNAKINHIILLSDGNTRTAYYYYNELIRKLQKENITVSTVALGAWLVNTKLLKDLSKKTKGQFYQISDVIRLPRLVIQDSASFTSQSDFHEEHFYPKINQKSQILEGIYEKQFPPLKGYTITKAKEKAEVPLITDTMGKTDPILANWRYGLGKVMIYTPDANSRWSSKWIKWIKFNKFWSQVVRWSMKDISKTDYDLKVEPLEDGALLVIESSTMIEDNTRLQVDLMTPKFDNVEQKLTLKQIAPRRFAMKLKDVVPGTYTLKVSRIKDGNVVDLKTKGLIIPESTVIKPLEKSGQATNVSLLKDIAQITGGRYNPKKEEIGVEEEETNKIKDFVSFLVPLAMALLIFDIAVRKFKRQMV